MVFPSMGLQLLHPAIKSNTIYSAALAHRFLPNPAAYLLTSWQPPKLSSLHHLPFYLPLGFSFSHGQKGGWLEALRRLSVVKHYYHSRLYPLPNIANFTSRVNDSTVFSKLDLQKGYYQVPVAPEDIQKTAIITPFGMYALLRTLWTYKCWKHISTHYGSSSGRFTVLFYLHGQYSFFKI